MLLTVGATYLQIAQLKHDLVKKEALVQLYLDDVNERENQLKNGNHSAEGERYEAALGWWTCLHTIL